MHYSSCFIDNMWVHDMLMSFSKHNLFTTVEKIHEFSLPTALQINAAIFHHPSTPSTGSDNTLQWLSNNCIIFKTLHTTSLRQCLMIFAIVFNFAFSSGRMQYAPTMAIKE